MRQLPLGVRLRTSAIFDGFTTGANSELLAALRRPATGFAPLWIWGSSGTGKTHLLQAACADLGETAAYFPLARTAELPPVALYGFETRRVLCLDDVDAIAGDLAWETALFQMFNAAAELQTRLIFAARAAPRQLAWVLEDWQSRAGACVVYQLHELDDAGRIEALRTRARQRGLQLPQDTAEYLLKHTPRDLRSLLDLLDELDEASLVAQRKLTIPFIRDALERHAKIKP